MYAKIIKVSMILNGSKLYEWRIQSALAPLPGRKTYAKEVDDRMSKTNPYDKAHELARAIKESDIFRNYMEAKEQIDKKPEYKEKYCKYGKSKWRSTEPRYWERNWLRG